MNDLLLKQPDRTDLPGGGLVMRGVADLERGEITVESLLVSIACCDLKRKGLPLTRRLELDRDAKLELYDLLRAEGGDAYGGFNSLIQQLVSFQRALGVTARWTEV